MVDPGDVLGGEVGDVPGAVPQLVRARRPARPASQGRTLLHFSALREHFWWDMWASACRISMVKTAEVEVRRGLVCRLRSFPGYLRGGRQFLSNRLSNRHIVPLYGKSDGLFTRERKFAQR